MKIVLCYSPVHFLSPCVIGAGQNALVQNDVGEGMYTKAQFMAAEVS